jgi:hypothetical protein
VSILKSIAIWYFDWGWILTTIIGGVVGATCRLKTTLWWCLAMFLIGGFLLLIKHG